MRNINKLYVKLIISAAVGLFLAGAFTHIQYPCTNVALGKGCVSFEKAVMHPGDLVNNKQNSLTNFVEVFAVSSLVSFGILNFRKSLKRNKEKV